MRDEDEPDAEHLAPAALLGERVIGAEWQREQRNEQRGVRVRHVEIDRARAAEAVPDLAVDHLAARRVPVLNGAL